MSTPNGPSDVAPPPLRPKSLVDKSSGFMKTIERNQYERDSYEKEQQLLKAQREEAARKEKELEEEKQKEKEREKQQSEKWTHDAFEKQQKKYEVSGRGSRRGRGIESGGRGRGGGRGAMGTGRVEASQAPKEQLEEKKKRADQREKERPSMQLYKPPVRKIDERSSQDTDVSRGSSAGKKKITGFVNSPEKGNASKLVGTGKDLSGHSPAHSAAVTSSPAEGDNLEKKRGEGSARGSHNEQGKSHTRIGGKETSKDNTSTGTGGRPGESSVAENKNERYSWADEVEHAVSGRSRGSRGSNRRGDHNSSGRNDAGVSSGRGRGHPSNSQIVSSSRHDGTHIRTDERGERGRGRGSRGTRGTSRGGSSRGVGNNSATIERGTSRDSRRRSEERAAEMSKRDSHGPPQSATGEEGKKEGESSAHHSAASMDVTAVLAKLEYELQGRERTRMEAERRIEKEREADRQREIERCRELEQIAQERQADMQRMAVECQRIGVPFRPPPPSDAHRHSYHRASAAGQANNNGSNRPLLFVMDIETNTGVQPLPVYIGDDVNELADTFCKKHGIETYKVANLSAHIFQAAMSISPQQLSSVPVAYPPEQLLSTPTDPQGQRASSVDATTTESNHTAPSAVSANGSSVKSQKGVSVKKSFGKGMPAKGSASGKSPPAKTSSAEKGASSKNVSPEKNVAAKTPENRGASGKNDTNERVSGAKNSAVEKHSFTQSTTTGRSGKSDHRLKGERNQVEQVSEEKKGKEKPSKKVSNPTNAKNSVEISKVLRSPKTGKAKRKIVVKGKEDKEKITKKASPTATTNSTTEAGSATQVSKAVSVTQTGVQRDDMNGKDQESSEIATGRPDGTRNARVSGEKEKLGSWWQKESQQKDWFSDSWY